MVSPFGFDFWASKCRALPDDTKGGRFADPNNLQPSIEAFI
jgi:hypothetical protein